MYIYIRYIWRTFTSAGDFQTAANNSGQSHITPQTDSEHNVVVARVPPSSMLTKRTEPPKRCTLDCCSQTSQTITVADMLFWIHAALGLVPRPLLKFGIKRKEENRCQGGQAWCSAPYTSSFAMCGYLCLAWIPVHLLLCLA